jgi:hypothetical protein
MFEKHGNSNANETVVPTPQNTTNLKGSHMHVCIHIVCKQADGVNVRVKIQQSHVCAWQARWHFDHTAP